MAEKGDVRRVEFVGPQVGDELTEDGGLRPKQLIK
jgi:preprotein translocase subunit SecF